MKIRQLIAELEKLAEKQGDEVEVKTYSNIHWQMGEHIHVVNDRGSIEVQLMLGAP